MTEKFVTLPREVLEQALNALDAGVKISPNSVLHDRLRAALEQPQPKHEPLTDEEIDKLCPQFDDPMRREMWIIGFKAARGIK